MIYKVVGTDSTLVVGDYGAENFCICYFTHVFSEIDSANRLYVRMEGNPPYQVGLLLDIRNANYSPEYIFYMFKPIYEMLAGPNPDMEKIYSMVRIMGGALDLTDTIQEYRNDDIVFSSVVDAQLAKRQISLTDCLRKIANGEYNSLKYIESICCASNLVDIDKPKNINIDGEVITMDYSHLDFCPLFYPAAIFFDMSI